MPGDDKQSEQLVAGDLATSSLSVPVRQSRPECPRSANVPGQGAPGRHPRQYDLIEQLLALNDPELREPEPLGLDRSTAGGFRVPRTAERPVFAGARPSRRSPSGTCGYALNYARPVGFGSSLVVILANALPDRRLAVTS